MKSLRSVPFILALVIFCNIICLGQRPGYNQSLNPSSPFGSPSRGTTGAISGSVKDMQNNPLKDVRVELTDSSGAVVNGAYTSSNGGFEFSGIAAGTYTVVATAGVVQTSERVEANSWTSIVNLRMPTGAPQDGVQGNAISVAQFKIPSKARDEYRKAHEALAKEKLDEAAKHLEKALEVCPNYADALTLRGVLALNQKNPEAALADLDKAIKADANYAMAYMVMGSALNMQGKFDEAIRSLERGESLSPQSWQAHFELAKSYIGKADYPMALKHLERAQNMTPTEYPIIYFLQAHALLAMKQYPEAMAALQAYLRKDPSGPNRAEAEKMLQQAQAYMAKNQPSADR